MKLGILGGSFNPFHLGHLFLAEKALSTLKLDRVVFVPAYRSPFKLDGEYMEDNTNDRILMLASAITGDSRFTIDACEIKRGGVSYTVDTLEDIISRYLPDSKPALIIGDDLAEEFPKWQKSERILQLADIAVACRINSAKKYPFKHIKIKNDVVEISSSALREKIRGGNDWQPLVSPGTRVIIEERQLYGYSGRGRFKEPEPVNDIRRIEMAARQTLSTDRFLHSRHTAVHAYDLCRRFGLNPQDGYLAGIAHDLAKQHDNKQILKIIKSEGIKLSAIEKDKPNLLHGKAAAVLLRERFCIHNKEVLEAVALHTSGSENMGPLAKVIYIADKTESSRNLDSAMRKMCKEADLDSILYAVLERTISKLRAKDLVLFEDTVKLLNKVKEKKVEN